MRLLFVIPEYPPHSGGGIGTFYAQFLPQLVAQGHEVTVLVANPFSGEFEGYSEAGVTVSCVPKGAIAAQMSAFAHYASLPELQRSLATAWAAWEFIKGGQKFDAVETADWGLTFVPWIVSPEAPPTVVQLHGSMGQIDYYDPQLDKPVQGRLIRLIETGCFAVADALQSNSPSNAHYWQALIHREVDYLPPALALPHAEDLIESDSNTGAKSGSGVVVGRIQHWKGPAVLCEALQLLGDRAPEMIWIGRDTVYGQSGTFMSDWLAQQYPNLWRKKVQCVGTLSPQETRRHQREAAFTVVPSLWDVFNFTSAEGMACGQIVLCSEGAGAAALIESGVNGFRFAANDPQALAETLERCLALSAAERTQIQHAAQDTIRTLLDPERVAYQRSEAYAKLMHRGRWQTPPQEWLWEATTPRPFSGNPLAFLDALPLQPLVRYVFRRSLKKLWR